MGQCKGLDSFEESKGGGGRGWDRPAGPLPDWAGSTSPRCTGTASPAPACRVPTPHPLSRHSAPPSSPHSQPAERPSQPPTPPACTAPLPAPAGFARPLVGTVPRPGCPPATQQHHCSRRCPWWCKQQAGSWPDPPGSFTFSSREMRSVRQSVRPDLLRGPPALPPPPPTPCSDPLEPCGSSSPTPVPARGLRTRLPGSSHAGSGVAGNLTPPWPRQLHPPRACGHAPRISLLPRLPRTGRDPLVPCRFLGPWTTPAAQ